MSREVRVNGPEVRFTDAVRNLYPRVRAYAARHVDDADADDIAAETFVVAWRKLDNVTGSVDLPWLLAIARRLAANHRRAAQRRDVAETSAAAMTRHDDDITIADDDRLGVLAALSAADKEILALVAWEELSTAEIAVVLDCGRSTAAVRLHRARRRARRLLESCEPTAQPEGSTP